MLHILIKVLSRYNITLKILDIFSFIKRKITIKKIEKSLLNNIEGIKEYNIPIERFYENKPKGISGVARLKNADYFLEICLESHIPFLDELILVDNKSTDKTKEICKKLQKRYPDKIKFYEYPHSVIPPSDKNINIPSNSIHSLAYYYNRCFSKAKFSHVMKVDDDNFLITEKWKGLREKALKSKKYNIYWGLNLIKNGKGKIGVPAGYEYSGKGGDHGIYPVSPYTYYIQGKEWEIFVSNLKYERNGFSFFHLKFLKPNYGFQNLLGDNYQKWYEKQTTGKVLFNFKKLIEGKISYNLHKYIENLNKLIN